MADQEQHRRCRIAYAHIKARLARYGTAGRRSSRRVPLRVWQEFERRRQALKEQFLAGELDSEQYDAAVQRLSDELGTGVNQGDEASPTE